MPAREEAAWIRAAISLARESAENDGSPFGAVVVLGEQQWSGKNLTQSRGPIKHAEIVAIGRAIRESEEQDLGEAVLYTSCAPCTMCLATAFYAGIRKVVYSVDIADVRRLGSGDPSVEPTELNQLLGAPFDLRGGVLRQEGLDVLEFAMDRNGRL